MHVMKINYIFQFHFIGEILWPDEDDLIKITFEAKDLILSLLTHDPLIRLGAGGAMEIKNHQLFNQLHWDNLLSRKADFEPQLEGPDDTSYFDNRSDRYNHESFDEVGKATDQQAQGVNLHKDDGASISSDQNELFASFSSYTSRFQDSLDISSVASTDSSSAACSIVIDNQREEAAVCLFFLFQRIIFSSKCTKDRTLFEKNLKNYFFQ